MAFFKGLQWRAAVGYSSFRLNSADSHILQRIAKTWTTIYPGEQFLFKFMDESYLEQYMAERSFGTYFMLAALLTIITSCLGLMGLTRYNILKRTKEIGIRLVFGSGKGRIIKLLQRETIILVLISSLVGIPVAWLIVKRRLLNFSYRIDPSWWMFLVAIVITLLVVVATTFVQTWRASNQNPVESLQYE